MSAQSSSPAGAYRHQDWQLPDSHARRQAATRAGSTAIRRLWREATEVDYPSAHGETYARYHPGRDVVILAAYGYVKTCIELSDRPRWEQEHVRDQIHGDPDS